MPSEVDDENITTTGIRPMAEGQISDMAGVNAHTNLVGILGKTVKLIYPIKGMQHGASGQPGSYMVSHAKVREIEADLKAWGEALPMDFRPGNDGSPRMQRMQQLLRMAYAHVQMLLYRPFLHYISKPRTGRPVDDRSYACAAACINISRNIVHITEDMKKRGLLQGAYWFTMYTTFFAILSLCFFVLENTGDEGALEMYKEALAGRDTLASLAGKSMAADKCTKNLKVSYGNSWCLVEG
jgi:hypothetical protein